MLRFPSTHPRHQHGLSLLVCALAALPLLAPRSASAAPPPGARVAYQLLGANPGREQRLAARLGDSLAGSRPDMHSL
jgi:hypothetical protein